MKQSKNVDKYEKYKDVPHFELVKENATISIASIFMFQKGYEELFPFLRACEEFNCTVYFENEDITVIPNDDNSATRLLLTVYTAVASNPKIANDYMRYLNNLDKMNWVKSVHEPILTPKSSQQR